MTNRRRGGAPFVVLGVVATASSCTGYVGESAPIDQVGPQSDGSPAVACRGGVDSGPAHIRRLTRFEYDNTVHDLLGDNTAPAHAFPTEEKRLGFDNNAAALTVSPLLSEQYFLAADRLAAIAVESNLNGLVGCDPAGDAGGEEGCAGKFFATFAKRAYRRPPSAEELAILNEVYAAGKASSGHKTGIRLALTTMLLSPRFLYRVEGGVAAQPGETMVRLDPWETASRLSYLLWGSMPDAVLLAAAETGKLSTKEEIREQVDRMLTNPKARRRMADFNEQWLDLAALDTAEKDAKVFPRFSQAMVSLLRQETQVFLDKVIWDGAGDLGALFVAPYSFLNATLARYYGLPALSVQTETAAGSALPPGFQKVAMDGQKRAGLLTQGSIMTILAKADQTSPVLRGKFVRERLLCQSLPPPPYDATIVLPRIDKSLTTRERFTAHRALPACAGCHELMDPVGLGFENFDGIGRYRDIENGKPVDASGEVVGLPGGGSFMGAAELGQKLAASEQARNCATEVWFHYAYGRDDERGDNCTLALLKQRFAAGGYKIKELLIALTETDAFLYRPVVMGGGDK